MLRVFIYNDLNTKISLHKNDNYELLIHRNCPNVLSTDWKVQKPIAWLLWVYIVGLFV